MSVSPSGQREGAGGQTFPQLSPEELVNNHHPTSKLRVLEEQEGMGKKKKRNVRETAFCLDVGSVLELLPLDTVLRIGTLLLNFGGSELRGTAEGGREAGIRKQSLLWVVEGRSKSWSVCSLCTK